MTGIILAGGENTRMGKNKAFLQVKGKKIIDRTMEIFGEIFEEIILVTNSNSILEYEHFTCQLVTDLIPGKGSLGGIYTGLFYSSSFYSFVTACDMPFLNKEFIKYLTTRLDNFDVIVPRSPDGLQPLHAFYSQRCLKPVEELLKKDNLKITAFYPQIKLKEITPEEITSFDSKFISFFNLNSPQDWKKMKEREA